MSRTIKLSLILILTASSIIIVQSASASVPKPSVPEFTVQVLGTPYDVPATTTTTIDQYTGKETTTTTPGYHVENRTIKISIKNQPVDNGYRLYYNIRTKGQFGQQWAELYSYSIRNYYEDATVSKRSEYLSINCPIQSGEQYTVVSYPSAYEPDSVINFQVEAILGKEAKAYAPWHPFYPEYGGDYETAYKLVDISGWSNTQTITICNGEVTISALSTSPSPAQPTPTDSPTAEPTQNSTQAPIQPNTQTDVLSGFAWKDVALVVACSVIAALAVALVLSRRKKT